MSQWCSRLLARLFQPVQYGQKPEGRTVAFPSTHPPRTAASAAATATPQGHVRGRPPVATFSANPDAKGMPPVLARPQDCRGSSWPEFLVLPPPLWMGSHCSGWKPALALPNTTHVACPFHVLKVEFFLEPDTVVLV